MKKPKLIHCSFDEVYQFIPRVPKSRTDWEDDQIKRICVAPTIQDCLNAMPGAGQAIRWIRAAGMPVILHAYYLEADKVEYDTSDYVLDAEFTHEMWVLEEPKDWKRIDYEITSCSLIDGTDLTGKKIIGVRNVELKRTSYTDNLRSLIEGAGMDYIDFRKKCPEVTYGTLVRNLGEDTAEEFRQRREKVTKKRLFENMQRRVTAYREREAVT